MTLLLLASGSPRRQDLLGRFGLPFEVRAATVDETPLPGERPEALVRRLALAKAEAVADAQGGPGGPGPDVVVLGADTVVVLDDEILGKPADAHDAARMLERLAGRTHRVLTGLAVVHRGGPPGGPPPSAPGPGGTSAPPPATLAPAVRVEVDVEATEVTMVPFGPAEVAWYLATGEPFDKAGAYGIQGHGAILVSSIRGSWDNVVGLPLATTRRLLAAAGLDPLGV